MDVPRLRPLFHGATQAHMTADPCIHLSHLGRRRSISSSSGFGIMGGDHGRKSAATQRINQQKQLGKKARTHLSKQGHALSQQQVHNQPLPSQHKVHNQLLGHKQLQGHQQGLQ
ncbi:hypothetical protein ACQJBY_065248 [Aegilops geniculata]